MSRVHSFALVSILGASMILPLAKAQQTVFPPRVKFGEGGSHAWLVRFLVFGLLLFSSVSARAQTIVATLSTNGDARAVAVNTVTNKGYVAVCPGYHSGSNGTVAVIDGATNAATNINAGLCPTAVGVNSGTNKIYVANIGNTVGFGYFSGGSITIIDGSTNTITTISDSNAPWALAVNETANKIYVLHHQTSDVTVIDGSTNSQTTISDPNGHPSALAVNPVTNKIYVVDGNGIMVIDGATNTTTTVTDPNAVNPIAVAVNSTTNKVYVANHGDYPGTNPGNVTVIDGTSNSFITIATSGAIGPQGIAVNEATNKVYVSEANVFSLPWNWNGGVTIIDGKTNSVTTVRDTNNIAPSAVAADSSANLIYVANNGCYPPADSCLAPQGSVTVINGTTNSLMAIIDPHSSHPDGIAINPSTGKVYVANLGGSVTVIDERATPTSHTLMVNLVGNGSGTITSNPSGVDCGTSCTAKFPVGTPVMLSTSPSPGSEFAGWSGACAGSNPCHITMNSDAFATATFNSSATADFTITPASAVLTVPKGGQSTDVITIAPMNGSFPNAIELSCVVTGSTPLATCSLSSTSVHPGATGATSTLAITAPVQLARLTAGGSYGITGPLYAVVLPFPVLTLIGLSLGCDKFRGRQRRFRMRCLPLLVLFALLTGCGGTSGSNQQLQQPQNYTVTVTASSGITQHTTEIAVTIP